MKDTIWVNFNKIQALMTPFVGHSYANLPGHLATLLRQFTTNGFSNLATGAMISMSPPSMILSKHSYKYCCIAKSQRWLCKNGSKKRKIDAIGCPTLNSTVWKSQGIERCYGKDAGSG
jgi:hypothetical protein